MTRDYCEGNIQIQTIHESAMNIADNNTGARRRLGLSRLQTIHLDGFNAPTPPNSPVEECIIDRLSPMTATEDNSSPILSPSAFLSCHQIPLQIKDFKAFTFPQTKSFLSLLEQELVKIQQKFYTRDGEERMSSKDLGAVWRRIDYLEDSIMTLKEMEAEGR